MSNLFNFRYGKLGRGKTTALQYTSNKINGVVAQIRHIYIYIYIYIGGIGEDW